MRSYTFDAENRITGAAGYTYTYDADGNRVEKSNGSTGTIYWYMSPGIVAESDLSGNLKSEYVFFDGERVARKDFPGNAVSYYFSDHLKTASVITGSAGVITEDEDYYPWGGELQFVNSDSNHYKFTGKERDTETGLDYFGARYYGNWLGRFATPDPLLSSGRPWNPQTWNRYTYALNNPLRVIDPTGLYNLQNTCGAKDSKCNKQFHQNANKLKDGLDKLRNKVNGMNDGVEKTRLQTALNKLGTENDGNKVDVKFGAVAGGSGHTDFTLDANGAVDRSTVTLDPSKNSSINDYAISGAHEGTHIADYTDPRVATLTPFQDEYRAYQTSAWAFQALWSTSPLDSGAATSTIIGGQKTHTLSVGGNLIWDTSWAAADAQTLMDKGITNEVSGPHYNYPEAKPHNPWPD